MGAQRWATFDCYGTLIDWNAGIRGQLERLFGVQEAPRLLERYHELEPELESEPFHTYREVLTLALERLAQEESVQLPEGEAGALPRSRSRTGRRSRTCRRRSPSCATAAGSSRFSPTPTAT